MTLTCTVSFESLISDPDYGIDDIFIAYPLIGEDKMERLGRLMQRIRVSTEVNSIYGAKQLSALGERIEIGRAHV